MARLVVDGMNVVGSRPDGWWRDRHAAVRSLLRRLQQLVSVTGDEVTLALDGRPLPDVPEGDHGGVTVLYPGGPGRDGDQRIVELVSNDAHPPSLQVVTSDRGLRRRVEAVGAGIGGVGAFLRRLDEVADPGDGGGPSPDPLRPRSTWPEGDGR